MTPPPVIVAQILVDLCLGGTQVRVALHFEFGFDRAEARLHERIVVAVVRAAHALLHAGPPKHVAVVATSILSSPIAMVDQAGLWLPPAESLPQSGQHQSPGHLLVQFPA